MTLTSLSHQVTPKSSWLSNTKNDYNNGRRHESIKSMRSVNNASERSARCASDLCAKHGRSRRLTNGGITRRGSRLHMRRCTGER